MTDAAPLPVTIHGPAHAQAALAAAAEAGRAVEVWSAPGAALYRGVYWLPALLAGAARRHPAARWTCVLDCGDAPGLAVAALSAGHRTVCLHDAHPGALARLRAIADSRGARLLTARPAMIDLAHCADPIAACRALMDDRARSI